MDCSRWLESITKKETIRSILFQTRFSLESKVQKLWFRKQIYLNRYVIVRLARHDNRSRADERKDDESCRFRSRRFADAMDFNKFSPVIASLIAPSSRYVVGGRGRYQIATLRCRLCNSPERIRAVWFRARRTRGMSRGVMRSGGIFKWPYSCMEMREM